jgi:hypothetical protein
MYGWSLERGAVTRFEARLRGDRRDTYTLRYPRGVAEVRVSAAVFAGANRKSAAGNGSESAMRAGRYTVQLQPRSSDFSRLDSETEVDVGSPWTSVDPGFYTEVSPIEFGYHIGALKVGVDGIGHHASRVSSPVYAPAEEHLHTHPHV